MPLEQPVPIKPILKVEQGLPQFLDSVEGSHPQELLLQCPDEALGHPVALRGPDEARAGLDAQERQLLLEGSYSQIWCMKASSGVLLTLFTNTFASKLRHCLVRCPALVPVAQVRAIVVVEM